MLLNSLFTIQIIGCSLDRQAIRQESQEKDLLFERANLHWQGVRWNIPERAAAFFEDSLSRAQYEAQLKESPVRYTDVTIIHVKIDPKEETTSADWLRSGSVFVRTEAFGIDNVLQTKEQEQRWYRTKTGWWIQGE